MDFTKVQESQKTYYASGRPMPIELLKYASFLIIILEVVRIFLGAKGKQKIDEIVRFLQLVAGPEQLAQYAEKMNER